MLAHSLASSFLNPLPIRSYAPEATDPATQNQNVWNSWQVRNELLESPTIDPACISELTPPWRTFNAGGILTLSRVCRMGQAHHLSAAVLVLQSYSEQALLLRCLVKIESAFEINNIPRGRVTRVAEMTCSSAGPHRIFGRDSVARIPRKEVRSYSPMLSGRMAAASDEGLDAVVNHPQEDCRAAARRSQFVSTGLESGAFS